jgi:phage gp46-like protein
MESEIIVALGSEARVAENEVPHGKVNRGYWADALDDSGEQTGSRLWLLEDAPATPENARRAESFALEALRFLTSSRRARAVRPRAELIDTVIWLHIAVTLPSGIVRNFGPYRAN